MVKAVVLGAAGEHIPNRQESRHTHQLIANLNRRYWTAFVAPLEEQFQSYIGMK